MLKDYSGKAGRIRINSPDARVAFDSRNRRRQADGEFRPEPTGFVVRQSNLRPSATSSKSECCPPIFGLCPWPVRYIPGNNR